jgi:putative pyruvate formate lyase activating enzyme
VARQAISEMQRQVGVLKLDEMGIAKRGVLLRHLVMPGGVAGTAQIARFIASEVSPDTYVNVMAQYHPSGRVSHTRYSEINRRISDEEYRQALQAMCDAGLWRFDERQFRLWIW